MLYLAAGLILSSLAGSAREIPQGLGFRNAPRFIGQAATPKPLPHIMPPAHPWLAEQGKNGMHGDSAQTRAYPGPGPLGSNPQVRSRALAVVGGEGATFCFDSGGRLVTVSGRFTGMHLMLLDPETLDTLASYELPNRASNRTFNMQKIMTDTSGGGYFHLDDRDRAVIADADRHLQVVEARQHPNGDWYWHQVRDYDLNPVLPAGALVTDAVPDWNGLYWFVTRGGMVGTVDPVTGVINTHQLPGEEIQNSLAVAPDGVFIVSDHALYRFEADPGTGQPGWTFRETYDRGSQVKPGQINQGSGTTPTLVGDDLVAICDNADDRTNLLVYQRHNGFTGNRLVVKQPLFTSGQSATDNTLTAYGLSILAMNTYGAPASPFDRLETPSPGIVRVDIAPNRQSWQVVWESQEAWHTSPLALSMENGLIYSYTRSTRTRGWVKAWYLTAIDFQTGQTLFEVFSGAGVLYNNAWAPVGLGPDGTAYVGVLNGIVRIRDGLPGEPRQQRRRHWWPF